MAKTHRRVKVPRRVGEREKLLLVARRLAKGLSVPGYVKWTCTQCGQEFQQRREHGNQSWCPACKRGDGTLREIYLLTHSGKRFEDAGPIGGKIKRGLRKCLGWNIEQTPPTELQYWLALCEWLEIDHQPCPEHQIPLAEVLKRLKSTNEKQPIPQLPCDTSCDMSQQKKKKRRAPTQNAIDCGKDYRRDLVKDPTLKLNSFIDEWAELKNKSASSIRRVLSDNPELWKPAATKLRHVAAR
jgi:hypothetical protein